MSQSRVSLPETGFLRLNQILTFIPVGRTRWYLGVSFPNRSKSALVRSPTVPKMFVL